MPLDEAALDVESASNQDGRSNNPATKGACSNFVLLECSQTCLEAVALHLTHRVAQGSASRRSCAIASPQASQMP